MNHRPSSVIEARDPAVLQMLLDFYAKKAAVVVDVTANRRKMWKGVVWDGPVTYSDIDPTTHPDVIADFRSLPNVDSSVDVIVFDPPHLPAASASTAGKQQLIADYGLTWSPKGDHVASYFSPFLREAVRILRPEGLIFAKIKDFVHNHKYQWMMVEWVNAVKATEGLTACDLIVKRDPCGGNLKSGKWVKAHHVRNSHCYWIVVRKGKCESKN